MKELKIYTLSIALVFFAFPGTWAQGFVTPLSALTGDANLATADGQNINGKVFSYMAGMKGIVSLTLKDTDGNKHKFKAADIQSIRVKMDVLAKLELIAEQTKNIERIINADFNEIVDRKYAYYDQVKVPDKDRYVLTQLLNPGFSQKIKVYDIPGAKTGDTSVNGVAVSGSKAKAYYVTKDGQTYKISKSKYRKSQFSQLFGSCPDMDRFYPARDFDRFAEHVLYYELNCR